MKTPSVNSRILKLEVSKDTATRTSVNAVESRTTSLESDVATAKGDISTLQGDVATLTQGIQDSVSTHNTSPDSHADIRTLIDARALIEHQHARTDLPWITDPGAALLTAASASAQRTALGMTAWAVAPWTDGTTSDIHEGTQLYFTNARADARIAAQKGQAEGIMPLDSGGKAPLAYIPDALIGQVKFKGVWDAATNSPVLPSATASMGHYYVTSVAGSYGGIDYEVGDWCISDGTTWGKVDNSDAITSFAGRTGAILPIASDYSSFYLGLGAQAADSAMLGGQLPSHYEAAIGNPSANGYLLSSTTEGVRSWVAPYSHPATHAQSVIDSSTGWIADALDIRGRAYQPIDFGGSMSDWTTVEFIAFLSASGFFSSTAVSARGSWSYSSNRIISDTGCGRIHLAGALVEVFSGTVNEYMVRVTTAPASVDGVTRAKSVFIYQNHGSSYNPGWIRLANQPPNAFTGTKVIGVETLTFVDGFLVS